MKTSEKIDKVLPLIAKVKSELTSVLKSSDNPFFKSKYASLNSHLDVAEPLIEANGGVLLQPVNADNTVESIIYHVESGQFVSSQMFLLLPKNTMQDAGSAVTYARRYTLGALLSMKAEDDDANASSGREVVKTPKSNPTVKTSSLPATNNTVPVILTPPVQSIGVTAIAHGATTSQAVVINESLPVGSVQVTPLKKSTFRKSKPAENLANLQNPPAQNAVQDSEW